MENEILTGNIKKDIREFTIKDNPYKIVCEVGAVNDKYSGIAFQCIYKEDVIQPGSFIETNYGFEPIGELENDEQLIALLKAFSEAIAKEFDLVWMDKPVMEGMKNEL